MKTVMKRKCETCHHKYMQTKGCWMQTEKNPNIHFYDIAGGMPIFLGLVYAYHSQGTPHRSARV